jgi:exodeoxyribonuclease VII small subunit
LTKDARAMTKKAKETDDSAEQFDQQLEKLRSIVEKMEQGDLSLDASLKLFEEGIGLARRLFETLDRSEGRVEELLETMERVPFGRVEE